MGRCGAAVACRVLRTRSFPVDMTKDLSYLTAQQIELIRSKGYEPRGIGETAQHGDRGWALNREDALVRAFGHSPPGWPALLERKVEKDRDGHWCCLFFRRTASRKLAWVDASAAVSPLEAAANEYREAAAADRTAALEERRLAVEFNRISKAFEEARNAGDATRSRLEAALSALAKVACEETP